tara:strand:- start:71 stop:1093 length:1023 start_codon:yes stop_codon:yes gene_type:complete
MSKAAELAALIGSQSALSNRNLIINGAMGVSQRGTSAVTASGSGTFSLDRFKAFQNGDGGFDVSQSTVAPTGFNNSLKVDVTGADASIDAGAYKLLYYNFEGQDMSHLEWGTSNAKTITLSFWVRSTTTGNHSVGIRGGDASYNAYMTTYNIAVANTWEYKTVTIPGDTTASFTYDTDNTLWGVLVFSFATGSTYTVSSNNTFHAGNFIQATGAVNLFSSASNDWYITGLQLEVGEQATSFEHRSFGDELAKCQRYFFQLTDISSDGAGTFGQRYNNDTAKRTIEIQYPTTMRTSPTLTTTCPNTIDAAYIQPDGSTSVISGVNVAYATYFTAFAASAEL